MKSLQRLLTYSLLILTFLVSVFPFYWMLVIASHPTSEANKFPPNFIPGDLFITNVQTMLDQIDFVGALLNSVFVSTIVTIAQLFFCALAAFAFSRLQFKGKHFLFVFIIGTLMIPGQLGLVPSYMIMTRLDWINSFNALIVPGLVSAFGIFWIKQYMDTTLHPELVESARMDGCSNFQTFWRIALPTISPAMATLAILTFMYQWNDFLWPSIVLKDSAVHTIQIALRNLNKVYFRDVSVIMAGTFLATIPLLVVFVASSRYFISGITAGAVKG